jgi:aminoglycoside 3-N-acetyltransferase
VLLVGVGQCKNTYLHSVAEMLALPNRMEANLSSATVRHLNGEIVERPWRMYACDFTDDISKRFPQYEQAFRYHRCITDGFLGDAPTQLCDARGMKAVVESIFAASDCKDPLADESPIPPKLYCRRKA